MAARADQSERREEDTSNEILSQIFGQVKVTFSADDSCVGPIPLNDPEFVKSLQSESGVKLKCESKYDNGKQHPAQYFLEGTLNQVNQAQRYLESWVKRGDGRDLQEKPENGRIPQGSQRNGLLSQAASQERLRQTDTNGTVTRRKENEFSQGRLDRDELQGNARPDLDVGGEGGSRRNRSSESVTADHDPGKRDRPSSADSKRRTSGNGEAHKRERHGHSNSRQGRDSQSYPASSGLSGDHQAPPSTKPRHSHEEREGGASHSSGEKSGRYVPATGLASPYGTSDAVTNENSSSDSRVLPNKFHSPSASGSGISGDLRQTRNPERVADNQDNYRQRPPNGVEGQDHRRYPDEHVSSASDERERSQHPAGASPQPSVALEDLNSSPEGAVSEQLQASGGKDNINCVPVDAGVFAYIEKMHDARIKSIERQYNVKITAEDVDVNESTMLKITPIGTSTEENSRGANEAVVDLYSSVFSQLSHRTVQLEDTSIGSESLARAIADVQKLYKEVMVKVSGSKVMIYGMKELDVKVAKAMVTNRLYDTIRSASAIANHNKHEDETSPDDQLMERHPLPGHEDAGHPSAHQDLQHFEANEEHTEDAANGEDLSPRLQDDEEHLDTPRSHHRQAPLKYRLRHDKLSYKTAEGLKVRVYHGDITKEKVGAIVNAANESLVHAGGVAGAIAKAAGPMMTLDCTRYITKHGMLYPAKVMWTSGGNLPSQFVIHAVGPRWEEYRNKIECYETLKTTFLKCLEVAEKKLQVAAISMPLVSSGIFGMPITQCIDALYEAIAQFSQSWDPATNVLKEINVVEIQDDCVKEIQGRLIGKLTGDGGGAVVRHLDPGNQETSDVLGSRSDGQEHLPAGRQLKDSRDDELAGLDHRSSPYTEDYLGTASTGLLDRQRQEKIDDLFAASDTRQTHEGTQTSLLYPNATDFHTGGRYSGASRATTERDELSRFTGMHQFSSLPNLPRDDDDDYKGLSASSYRHLSGTSTGSRTRPQSTHLDIGLGTSAYNREPSRSSHTLNRLQNDISQRYHDVDLTTGKRGSSYESGKSGATALGATGGLTENTNESLIQSILNTHEKSKQTPTEIEETQKLLDLLLKKDDIPSGRSREREKGHRSRRTQSLDRATRKSKEKDLNLDNYDLHSDLRMKGKGTDDSAHQKCSVCYSKRDLIQRKECEHTVCRSCYKIGLYKGSCALCKSKSRGHSASSSSATRSGEQRGRSRAKKTMPDAKALPLPGHSTKDFHVRVGGSGVTGQRGRPVMALSATSPPSSPEWHGADVPTHHTSTNYRLDPVGQAPDKKYGSLDRYSRSNSLPGSRKDNARVEAWVANSDPTLNSGTATKTYDYTSYSDKPVTHGSSRSAARQRRHQESEPTTQLSLEGKKQDLSSRDKSGTGRGGGEGAGGDTATSAASKVTCPICMDVIKNPKTLSECKHTFCTSCIDKAMKLKSLCPICGVVYGQLYGNQPAGTMTNYVEPTDLPGHEGCGTIVISYRFPDGVQSDDHPSPGQPFRGTARMAYLPNNIEGQGVFRLLEKAFKSRLLFTVGQSVTTGEQNTVVWNDIHHKTRRTGGAQNHGYPDPDYLRRVKEELSAKGIK